MTSNEICRLLDITGRELQWWHETGAVACVYDDRHYRVFDDEQALIVAIVAELRWKGVPLTRIRKMKLRQALGEFLVVGRVARRWCTRADLIDCVVDLPGACVVVSVEDQRAKLWPVQKTYASQPSAAAMQTR